jgi:hypothetical protein
VELNGKVPVLLANGALRGYGIASPTSAMRRKGESMRPPALTSTNAGDGGRCEVKSHGLCALIACAGVFVLFG